MHCCFSSAQDKETKTRSQQVVYALHTAGAAMRGLSGLTRQAGPGLASDLVRDLDTAVVDVLLTAPILDWDCQSSEWPAILNAWLKLVSRQFHTHPSARGRGCAAACEMRLGNTLNCWRYAGRKSWIPPPSMS